MIYLDYAAATPLDPQVAKVMSEIGKKSFANPSSAHILGRKARNLLEDARKDIAHELGCKSRELVFTGSATEANNLAVFGLAQKFGKGHIITTTLEHASVIQPIKELKRRGFKVTYSKPNKNGLIDPQDILQALRKDTFLISIIYASNTIGTIQPIHEISRLVKSQQPEIIIHTDACQAINYLNAQTAWLGVDLMSFNGSKIYGPKGIGCLFVKSGTELSPIIHGGGHEQGLRSGTENVTGIIGLAEAIKTANRLKARESKRLRELRDYVLGAVAQNPKIEINGDLKKRLPNNINISVASYDDHTRLAFELENRGFLISGGAACDAHKSGFRSDNLRVTLGRETQKNDIVKLVETIERLII